MQHTRLLATHRELGVGMIDMLRLCQAAAHEQCWDLIFSSLRT